MSNVIDQKVVEMKFDNAQFEKNVQTSISSIDQLKQSLRMDGVSDGIMVVAQKFSALETMAAGALFRIGQQAVDAGEKLIKSLTIDQISAGWEKFADKTTSVQTIMAATRETWEDSANAMARTQWLIEKGVDKTLASGLAKQADDIKNGVVSVEDAVIGLGGTYDIVLSNLTNRMTGIRYQGDQMRFVNEQLERLNWFTDETSYKLIDMSSNIGKFTSAGVGLEDAVSAMEGIANWAAISGGNANSASIAMYNMSQALGSGAVLAVDWKSIENQNMATAEFKQIVIETAEELGTLRKISDDTWATMDDNAVSVKNFRENLKDRWFNDEVLLKSLQKYGDFAVELQQVAAETDLSAKELLDNLDAYKTAAGGMADFLVKEGVNENLAEGVASRYKQIASGMMTMEQAAEELGTTPVVISNLTKRLDKFMDGAVDFEAMLEEIKETCPDTTLTIEDLRKEFNLLTDDTMDLGMRAFKAAQEAKTFQEAIDYVREAVSTGWLKTFELIFGNYEEAKELWSNLAEEFYTIFVESGDIRNEILKEWKDLGGRNDVVEAFWNIFHAITAIVQAIREAIQDVFNPLLSDTENGASRLKDLTSRLKEFSEVLKLTDDETGELNETGQKIKSTFKGVFTIFGIIGDVLSALIKPILQLIPGFGKLGSGVLDVTANVGDMLVSFRKFMHSSGFLSEVQMYLEMGVVTLKKFGETVVRFIRDLGPIGEVVKQVFDWIRDSVIDLWNSLDSHDLSVPLDKVKESLQNFNKGVAPVKNALEKIKMVFQKIAPYVGGVVKGFGAVFYGVGLVFAEFGRKIAAFLKEASVMDILNFVKGIAQTFLMFKTGNFLKSITKFPETVNGFLDALKSFTDGIKESAEKLGNKVLKFAISMAILAGAIFLLSKIDIPSLLTASAAIGALMYLMGQIAKSLDGSVTKKGDKFHSGATQMLAFSVAILILAKAIKKIADINPVQLATATFAIGILMLAMYAITDQLSKRKSKDIGGGLSQLMAIAAGVLILSLAIKSLSKLNITQLGLGILAISIMLAELKWVMKGMSNNGMSGKQIIASSLYILSFATAIKKLAKVLISLSTLKWTELAKGLTGLTLIIGEVIIAANLMRGTEKGAESMVASAVGLLLFAGVIKIFAAMKWETIGKGLLAIGAAFATVAISAALLTPVIDTVVKFGKTFWKIGVGLLAIAAAMMVFSLAAPLFYVSAGLIGKGIVILLGELITAIPQLISALVSSIYDSAENIIEGIAAMIGLICAAIRSSAQEIVDTLLDLLVTVLDGLAQRADAIYDSLLQILVFGFLEALGNKISEAVPMLAENMKSIFEALMDALSVFGAGDMLQTLAAINTLEKIMWKLSVIAGMAWIASGALPKIGEKLSQFGIKAAPFFRALRIVTPAHLVASESLARMLVIMTSAGIKDALTSWFTGKNRLTELGQQLADFAPYFRRYSNNVSGMDTLSVINSAVALEAVANVYIPYMDSQPFETLAEGLEAIGSKLGTYSDNVKDIKPESVAVSAEAITELSSALYNIQTINTEDVSAFAQSLLDFAPYMVAYGSIVSTMNVGAIINSMTAANAVADFANNIPTSGGLKDLITGDNDMNLFGSFLKSFGQSLVDYSLIVSLLDIGLVLNSLVAANAIIDMALRIPSQSKNIFTGDKSLSFFGQNMAGFGAGMVSYFNVISGIGFQRIIDSKEAAIAIIEIAELIPSQSYNIFTGDKSLDFFGQNMAGFASGMASYFNAISGIGFQRIIDSAEAAKEIIEIAKLIPSQSYNIFTGDKSLGFFGQNMSDFGTGLAGYFGAISGIGFQRISDSAEAAKEIIEIAKLIPSQSYNIFTGDKSLGFFGQNMAGFGAGMAGYFRAVSGIGFQRISDSAEAAKEIIEIAKLIPSQSKNIFTGDKSLGTFGQNMSDFGAGLASYFGAISGIGFQRIIDSIEPARALIELGNSMGTGSFEGWLFGYKTFSDFGVELEAFGNSMKTLSDSFSSVDTTVFARVRTALNILTSIKVDELTPVLEQMENLLDVVFTIDSYGSENIDALSSALKNLAESGISEMANSFGDTESIATMVSTFMDNLVAEIDNHEKIQNAATDLVKAFTDKIKSEMDNKDRTFAPGIVRMKNNILTYKSSFGVAGAMLVAGFTNGITANTWRAEAAAKAMAAAAERSAKKELEQNSPSKKFYRIGEGTTEGFVGAMEDGQKAVSKSAADLANASYQGFTAAVKHIAAFVESGMDTRPTIRPVLDLTDVSDGFSNLNAMFSRKQAVSIGASMPTSGASGINEDGTSSSIGNTYNFTQNNYSPKALSASDIYRQTKNQFSRVKGWVSSR